MGDFVHLHLHSDRSALDSISPPKEIARRAKECDMPAIAVTDHGVVSAAISLYKACQPEKKPSDENARWNEAWTKQIKPIIGCELYLSVTDDHTLKEPTPNVPKQQCYHLTALAKNATGVSQLFELSSRGYLEGYYYKPRVSLPMVEEIGKDLIILGACAKGPVSWNLREGNEAEAKRWLTRLKEMFPERFYLEMMDHNMKWQKDLNVALAAVSEAYEVPWVPTNDAHFIRAEDHYEHSLMMCLQLKQTLETLTMAYPPDCYIKSPDEMITIFGEEACRRTVAIAEEVDIELKLGETFFPEYSDDAREKVGSTNDTASNSTE